MIITLKDGSKKEYSQPMAVIDIAADISEGLARVVTAGEVNGETVDLRTVPSASSLLRIRREPELSGTPLPILWPRLLRDCIPR